MSTRTVLTDLINEGTTPYLTFTIVNRLEEGFKPTTLALTLYNYNDGAIINSRLNQDVMDKEGCATASDGVTTFQFTKEDNIIVDSDASVEIHVAYFEWTWNSGLYVGSHEIELRIQNLTKKG
jgi:hypothetical protein